VSQTEILPANLSNSWSSGKIGLFIPDGIYDNAINITNKGYQDIIINSNTFQMNTNTLLGNPIKRIYISIHTVNRTW
jgi:hypothetical protein